MRCGGVFWCVGVVGGGFVYAIYNCVCRNARMPRGYPVYGTPTDGFGRVRSAISSSLAFTAMRILNRTCGSDIGRRIVGNLGSRFTNRYNRMNVCLTVTHRTSHRNCPRVTRTCGHCTFRRTSRTSHFTRLLNRILNSAGDGLRTHVTTRGNTYRSGFHVTGLTGRRNSSTVRSAIRRVTGSRTHRYTNFTNLCGECFGWSCFWFFSVLDPKTQFQVVRVRGQTSSF